MDTRGNKEARRRTEWREDPTTTALVRSDADVPTQFEARHGDDDGDRRPAGPSTTRLDLDVPQQPIGGQPSRSCCTPGHMGHGLMVGLCGVLGSVSNLARARCVAARQEGAAAQQRRRRLWDTSSTSTPRSSPTATGFCMLAARERKPSKHG